jgi:hypothetical protein
MADRYPRPPKPTRGALDANRLDKIVAEARHGHAERMEGYRAQALKLYPWVCGRCGRGFDRINLHEITITITTRPTGATGSCCAVTATTTSTPATPISCAGRG